ncbi:unnamed protein product [Amoebophrya sp. A120]|nr:unnamed protein product [Amoebophrya sp. A120]|eukprot:GSA120T00000662001.1
MGSDDGGRKVAVMCAAAGALALGSLAAYYAVSSMSSSSSKNEFDGNVTAAQMVQLLEEIVESQQDMKRMMDDLMQEITAKDLSFAEICALVQQRKPRDLLEEKNISIKRFSSLLEEFSHNPTIRAKVVQLTQSQAEPSSSKSTISPEHVAKLAEKHSVTEVIAIHEYMLEQLQSILRETTSTEFSSRVATISSQAFVAKLVKRKYGLSSEELEAVVANYQQQLGTNDRFFELGIEMREAVQSLVKKATASGGPAVA